MYRSMIKMHYKGVHVCILVYDITDKKSFNALELWLNDVRDKLQEKQMPRASARASV